MKQKEVKTITIQVEPVYFNLDSWTEKMIIKRNQVSFRSKNRLYEGHEDKWTYKSNNQNMDILYDFINKEVTRLMDLGLERYTMDGELVTITQVFEDNTRRTKIFTGSFKINDLDILGSFLLELVPNLESTPSFLLEFKEETEDLEL